MGTGFGRLGRFSFETAVHPKKVGQRTLVNLGIVYPVSTMGSRFTRTGIFPVRLLQSALIRDPGLARKYREELHANELVLLGYYIAAIHIEEAFHGQVGDGGEYEPFGVGDHLKARIVDHFARWAR